MTKVFDRFDLFQKQAVASIASDFRDNPGGRFLLVVPTGGGKTFTAVKAVVRLFEEFQLNENTDRVAWVAHREELLDQADGTFEKLKLLRSGTNCFKDNVDFLMLSQVDDYFRHAESTKLVVIDEAHHGAAPSYQPIFDRSNMGVLGLTATPSRHDGAPLEFERESYSIGFPDLVDLGIVLRPEVVNIRGSRFSIESLDDKYCLEQLNTEERNRQIISALLEGQEKYKKVVIFVGTKNHVKSIYSQIIQSELSNEYESIAWITGDGNCRGEERADFLRKEKAWARSILINVQVLSEGYDDPSIDTVVMASPTRSKLVYMQAMGRAIRRNPEDEGKHAYVLEVTDDLPNIRYRIDNRWLYSDVSDALEPAVIDIAFESEAELLHKISEVLIEHNVPEALMPTLNYRDHDRYTMLLFNVYERHDEYFSFPLLVDNENRPAVSNMFNFLSERMRDYVEKSINARSAFKMIDTSKIAGLASEQHKRFVFDAMSNAAAYGNSSLENRAWISFVAFKRTAKQSNIAPELLKFVEGMINKDEILARVSSGAFESSAILARLPLPLASFVGKILTREEFAEADRLVSELRVIKKECGDEDHRARLISLLDYTAMPLEAIYRNSLALIVREDINYSFELDGAKR